MKKMVALSAAAGLILAVSGTAFAGGAAPAPNCEGPNYAAGPHGMFNRDDDTGKCYRDICGGDSVAAHASEMSNGKSKVGQNGQAQWFDGDFAGTCPGADQSVGDGRCDDPTKTNAGRGHIADNNCPPG